MENTKKIEQRVFAFIEKHKMLTPGEGVVVGVSGGADSVCLLFVLSEWAARKGASIHVVHVNHGIREDAGRDGEYVRKLCEELEVPMTLIERNVKEEARKHKCSEEEMGRILRYQAFEETADRVGVQKIAVAHNENDQAETMLFHLFRGSGLSGLCGIRPVRGRIIRPLLCLERREIEQYLREKDIPFCLDSTNEEDDYARNRIRHHILPYAREQISDGCIPHMNRTAEEMQELEEFLEEQVRIAYDEIVRRERSTESRNGQEGIRFLLDRRLFLELSPVIGKRLLKKVLQQLSPWGKDIGRVHIEALIGLFSREGNGRVDLPCQILARRQYDAVILERSKEARRGNAADFGKGKNPSAEGVEEGEYLKRTGDVVQVDIRSLTGRETVVPAGEDKALGFALLEGKKVENIPKNQYTKWFDYDKINQLLTVRRREPGDFLTLRGGGQDQIHQSLGRFMMNEKIPAKERDRTILLAEGQHVLWVIGHRISEFYKVGENTRTILQVRFLRREGESFMEMEERKCQSI